MSKWFRFLGIAGLLVAALWSAAVITGAGSLERKLFALEPAFAFFFGSMIFLGIHGVLEKLAEIAESARKSADSLYKIQTKPDVRP